MWYDNKANQPDKESKLMTSFINCVEIMTSSNTGILPPMGENYLPWVKTRYPFILQLTVWYDNKANQPDNASKLMTSFISCVEIMTSSNTRTLPPMGENYLPWVKTRYPFILQLTVWYDNKANQPDNASKLMTSFISCVEIMTSSNTGTLPPMGENYLPWVKTRYPFILQLTVWYDNKANQPDNASKLMTSYISCVEIMTSSNTGTLPPTSPVFPPCGTTARLLS